MVQFVRLCSKQGCSARILQPIILDREGVVGGNVPAEIETERFHIHHSLLSFLKSKEQACAPSCWGGIRS